MIEVETEQGRARVHTHEAKGEPAGSLLLTHGAGGGIEAADLAAIAELLPERGWQVALVEMPWRVAGKKVAPMPPRLDAAWREIVPAVREVLPGHLIMGERSAGARVACRLAGELGADGVLCLSFPLVPPGKGEEKSRIRELITPLEHDLPVHVVQGAKDPFGGPDAVREAVARQGIEQQGIGQQGVEQQGIGQQGVEQQGIDPGQVRVDGAPGTHSFTDGPAVAELVAFALGHTAR